jgi:hypothetical protein
MDEQRWFLTESDESVSDDDWVKAIEDAHRRDLEEAFADSDAA